MAKLIKNIQQHFSELNENYLDFFDSAAMKMLSDSECQFVIDGLRYCKQGSTELKLLELGVGPGRILSILADRSCEVCGIDVSFEMLRAAEQRLAARRKKALLVQNDFSKGIPFREGTWDGIIAIRSIKYNPNWQEILLDIHQKLGPGGIVIFTMLNNRYAFNSLKMFKRNIQEYGVDRQELQEYLSQIRFECLSFEEKFILPLKIYRHFGKFAATAGFLFRVDRLLCKIPFLRSHVQFFYLICQKATS